MRDEFGRLAASALRHADAGEHGREHEPGVDRGEHLLGELGVGSRRPHHRDEVVDGLLTALAGWRAVALHLAQHGDPADLRDARAVLHHVPRDVRFLDF